MLSTVGEAQCRHIHQALSAGGQRLDGRLPLQHRPLGIQLRAIPHVDGSCLVTIDGTEVLVSLSVSVAETPTGHGELRVHVECAPSVTGHYARAMGGSDGRYHRIFHSRLSNAITQFFGATTVTVTDNGTAEAVALDATNREAPAAPTDDEELLESTTHATHAAGGPSPSTTTGGGVFSEAAASLALGSGFAFCIDADVHVMQCVGGNVTGAVCAGLRCALRSCRLPHVTLHDTPSGVSVEVDRSRQWTGRSADWSRLPFVTVAHWIPGQYIVDPTLEEEIALPSLVTVASSDANSLSSYIVECLPSRRGLSGSEGVMGIPRMDLKAILTECVTTCEHLRLDTDALAVAEDDESAPLP
mmetsp:Transcript_45118/g.52184  ORF Transcript_45118/g.52184 Transcript_45118/m.52184 type:complete len:358 (+) Transcript_45118:40-1113(+)